MMGRSLNFFLLTSGVLARTVHADSWGYCNSDPEFIEYGGGVRVTSSTTCGSWCANVAENMVGTRTSEHRYEGDNTVVICNGVEMMAYIPGICECTGFYLNEGGHQNCYEGSEEEACSPPSPSPPYVPPSPSPPAGGRTKAEQKYENPDGTCKKPYPPCGGDGDPEYPPIGVAFCSDNTGTYCKDTSVTAIIAGSAAGGGALIILIVVCCCCRCRKKKRELAGIVKLTNEEGIEMTNTELPTLPPAPPTAPLPTPAPAGGLPTPPLPVPLPAAAAVTPVAPVPVALPAVPAAAAAATPVAPVPVALPAVPAAAAAATPVAPVPVALPAVPAAAAAAATPVAPVPVALPAAPAAAPAAPVAELAVPAAAATPAVPAPEAAAPTSIEADNPFAEAAAVEAGDDGVYKALFATASPDADGLLTAKNAGVLLSSSGLKPIDLRTIWTAAKAEGPGTCPKNKMDLAEFTIAARKAKEAGGTFA